MWGHNYLWLNIKQLFYAIERLWVEFLQNNSFENIYILPNTKIEIIVNSADSFNDVHLHQLIQ